MKATVRSEDVGNLERGSMVSKDVITSKNEVICLLVCVFVLKSVGL